MVSDRRFRSQMPLIVGPFLSSGAVMVLYLVQSVAIFEATQSSFLAALVFATQWALPMVLFPVTANLCSAVPPRPVLVGSELMAALWTLGIVLASGRVELVLAALLIRGAFDSVTKTAASVALKHHVAAEELQRMNSASEAARIIGMSVAAAASVVLLRHFTVGQITFGTAAMLALSAAAYAALPGGWGEGTRSQPKVASLVASARRAIGLLAARPQLRTPLLLLLVTIGFQGLHNVARTTLPMQHLGLGADGVAAVSGFGALAIALGALAMTRKRIAGWFMPAPPLVLVAVPAGLLLAASLIPAAIPAITVYVAFLFFFEIGFVVFSNKIMLESQAGEIAQISALRLALVPAALLAVTLSTGWLSDLFGFLGAVIALNVFLLTCAGLLLAGHSERMAGWEGLEARAGAKSGDGN